jgi:NADH dehydrogenase
MVITLDSKFVNDENGTQKTIVVLGAGVAGIQIVHKLQNNLPDQWRLVLIEENDYHQYLYNIHEICNKEYNINDIKTPLSQIINMEKIVYKQETVESIDEQKSLVITNKSTIHFDVLAVCLGSHPVFYNIEGLEDYSLTLGNFDQALKIRAKIIELLDKVQESKIPLQIVIGGAGFTGIELSGELAEWLKVKYEEYDVPIPSNILTIVEAFPTILPGWDGELGLEAQSILERKGVEFILNNPVIKVEENMIVLQDGCILENDVFIWTGGVGYDPACGSTFEVLSRRLVVDEFCRVKDNLRIFVAGDSACTVDSFGNFQPPSAHIAMSQGNIVGFNILSLILGKPMKRFDFRRVGEIVTLGRSNALGELFGFKFKGITAKIMKKIIHFWYVTSIGGFRLLLIR